MLVNMYEIVMLLFSVKIFHRHTEKLKTASNKVTTYITKYFYNNMSPRLKVWA